MPLLQASLRTNDLLNAVRYLQHQQPALLEGVNRGGEPGIEPGVTVGDGGGAQAGQTAECPMLVGDAYYDAKARLINDEQVLLRVLCFDIGVEQPHKYLYCFAKTLLAPGIVVRLATCIVNDTLVYLNTCLTLPPEAVAAAALHVAATLAHAPLAQGPQGHCWDVLGLELEVVVSSCGVMEGMLAQAEK
jgi:hypothetical protein